MTTITEIWEKYKGLPNWKKFLLGIPLLLLFLALALLYVFQNKTPQVNETILDHNREQVDNEIETLDETLRKTDEKLKEIDKKKKELQGQANEIQEEHGKFSNRINNATTDDELLRIAADLRAAAKNRQ